MRLNNIWIGFLIFVKPTFSFVNKRFITPSNIILASQKKYYPFSKKYHTECLNLNRKNNTNTQPTLIIDPTIFEVVARNQNKFKGYKRFINQFPIENEDDETINNTNDNENDDENSYKNTKKRLDLKSENFEVIKTFSTKFKDIGGYENIKSELKQCIDLLCNHTKYSGFNVRVPKGLIFEGPPGNGKTLFAKALAGEANIGFISVSGSEFNEKYVGVGSSRIRELFQLAKKNAPCIIFIDEIDALGRKRSGDGETSTSEKDTTLNELLVALDGFKNITGVFLVGATNRIDLLDPALVRPGRIDKHIYIGNPDACTRNKVLTIHLNGKPYNNTSINIENLTDLTNGLSCSQIENLLNEALLNALLHDREKIERNDLDNVMGKIMSGWMANPHQFNDEMMNKIAVHEMGHVICGLMSKNHPKIVKVVVNLHSPNSPAYTIFENGGGNIQTKESLKEHLMILLAGRVAEENMFGVSITTGAINDFEEALKLAQKMVVYYGMGKKLIYPQNSDSYKKMVDDEVVVLLEEAYVNARLIVEKHKEFIIKGSIILKSNNIIKHDELVNLLLSS